MGGGGGEVAEEVAMEGKAAEGCAIAGKAAEEGANEGKAVEVCAIEGKSPEKCAIEGRKSACACPLREPSRARLRRDWQSTPRSRRDVLRAKMCDLICYDIIENYFM